MAEVSVVSSALLILLKILEFRSIQPTYIFHSNLETLMENNYLFSLLPRTSAASRVVEDNSQHHRKVNGKYRLSFKAGYKSKFPGRFVSIGSRPSHNDILIPSDEYLELHLTISSFQCHFRFVSTGELMFQDSTNGHDTYIIWTDSQGIQEKYDLQGNSGIFGRELSFEFVWEIPTSEEKESIKRGQEVPQDPILAPRAFEPKTINTPKVPAEYDGRPLIETHSYGTIGSGTFGEVSDEVDLATGKLWAVKQCRNPGKTEGETWKAAFKHEVEKLVQLHHSNIIHLEHHQGWSVGRPVELFFKLCVGNVDSLLPQTHKCTKISKVHQEWLADFISQTLSGLAFMHQNDMVHRDIKPDNILFDYRPDNSGKNFYISDFGLTSSTASVTGLAGTPAYMPPESTRHGKCDTASDVYSFGITLLEVLGIYCPREAYLTDSEWRKKLKAYGVREYRDYRDTYFPGAYIPRFETAHSRVKSLVDYSLVRSAVKRILNQDPQNRSTAAEARRDLLRIYGK
ncbi:kinase-like domain-containing protein [Xylogone sp. PMI_703]|nr:kinase-like domain-containing protein [Xylogone sp. PMI_703]